MIYYSILYFPFLYIVGQSPLLIPLQNEGRAITVKYAVKNHIVAFIGESVRTFLSLFLGFAGAQTVSQPVAGASITAGPNAEKLLYISLVFEFSLAINAWIFFRVSSGLFNTAVTWALYLVRVVPLLNYA